ncbi:solute carrier family 2, facilitated glucose transporter member 12-like [Musca vetustissima]|uniref:solute carrier family 2, facilitated glucose transporter member 12-like n=1 Tax=Musca vetustissima TaxID=27455 RepID=UPI002AB70093|nr:solute carrier family 2, facilitated glucose transporter member 12-like [Musca vetustissima]XP_061399729.1 solute carrier family 2, facilitated glucose transporter member 12-like [Musca vetustissima]
MITRFLIDGSLCFLQCFASLLVTISGILLVINSSSLDSLVAARYINGIALGLVFPLTFVLVGEQCVKGMRGMNAAAIGMCFQLGILLQIIYMYIWPPDSSFDGSQMLGILSILWGFISFIIAFMLQLESPIFYLARGQEEIAIDVLRRLQRPFTITHETYEQLMEHKRYLAENKENTFLQSALIGLPALVKLSFYRVFVAASSCFYTYFALSYASTIAYSPDAIWTYYIYGILAWIGTMVVTFIVDSKGRRTPMIVGFFCCSCLCLAIGCIFDDTKNIKNVETMTIVLYLLITYQLFAGIATASSFVYLTEAFPLAVKPYFVAIAFIVEMSIHIVVIAIRSEPWRFNVYDLPEYFYTVGGLSIGFFVIAVTAMPETKKDTLRECLVKFRRLINKQT